MEFAKIETSLYHQLVVREPYVVAVYIKHNVMKIKVFNALKGMEIVFQCRNLVLGTVFINLCGIDFSDDSNYMVIVTKTRRIEVDMLTHCLKKAEVTANCMSVGAQKYVIGDTYFVSVFNLGQYEELPSMGKPHAQFRVRCNLTAVLIFDHDQYIALAGLTVLCVMKASGKTTYSSFKTSARALAFCTYRANCLIWSDAQTIKIGNFMTGATENIFIMGFRASYIICRKDSILYSFGNYVGTICNNQVNHNRVPDLSTSSDKIVPAHNCLIRMIATHRYSAAYSGFSIYPLPRVHSDNSNVGALVGSRLHMALLYQDLEGVLGNNEAEQHLKINAAKQSPFELAVSRKMIETVKYFLDSKKADVKMLRTSDGGTMLHAAVRAGEPELVARLMDEGLDVFAKNGAHQMALELAMKPFNADIAQMLLQKCLEKELQIDLLPSYFGGSMLHMAAEHGLVDTAKRLLSHFDVNGTDSNGRTPLHLAMRQSDSEMRKLLVECKASMDIRDLDGWLPRYPVVPGQLIPAELWVVIMAELLAPKDIKSMACTCRLFYAISKFNVVAKRLLK